jgi:hypothetical protein
MSIYSGKWRSIRPVYPRDDNTTKMQLVGATICDEAIEERIKWRFLVSRIAFEDEK